MSSTPGIFSATEASSRVIRPLAIVAPTGTACAMRSKWKSAAYWAEPVVFSGPSMRGVALPTIEAGLRIVVSSFTARAPFAYTQNLNNLRFEQVFDTYRQLA